jgi:hypothetical protein
MDVNSADFVMGLALGAIFGVVLITWIRSWLEAAEDEPEWHQSRPYPESLDD